jgi:transcriptional regulator with PAS, ATPase and Fis domain
MQPKLLRVLQERTLQRIGGTNSIPVDIRIIAATNQNIEEMMLQKKFRPDLYYRLNVIPLNMPSLRQRKEDIPYISLHFLEKFCRKLNREIKGFSKEATNMLLAYNWPGNIRELENLVEYAVNMECTDMISIQSFPDNFMDYECSLNFKLKEDIRSVEASSIRASLDRYGWDLNGKKQAAKELGIGLRTLYRKLENSNN